MQRPPLNAEQDFALWPSFSPSDWLDFNPTIVTLQTGRNIALIRRDKVPPIPGEGSIWYVHVDADLRPSDEPILLIARGEDPRAVVIGDRLYLFYVVIEKDSTGRILGSCVMLAEFTTSTYPLTITGNYALPKNPTSNPALTNVTWEKNWVPFVCGEYQIALIYSHEPWTVLILNVESLNSAPKLELAYKDKSLFWSYGEIRGGTSPVKYDDDHLITFFHSAQVIGSRNVYMVGACVFNIDAPFSPQLMTYEPLLCAPYRSIAGRFGWPVLASVIFPLGAVRQQDDYRLLCGIDDGEIGTFTIKEYDLKHRLKPILVKPVKALVASDATIKTLPDGPMILTPYPSQTSTHIPIARFLKMLPNRRGNYLDIGAEVGLFLVYLCDKFSRLIAIETLDSKWLEWNMTSNGIDNFTIYNNTDNYEELFQNFSDVTLIRLNVEDWLQILFEAKPLIRRDKPIILIHLKGSLEDKEALDAFMASLGYSVEHLFPLTPQVVLCTKLIHRESCRWLL